MFASMENLKSELREKLDQPKEEVIDKSSSSVMVLFHFLVERQVLHTS